MTEKEFLAMREKFMKGLIAKKLPVKSVQTALNFEQGKGRNNSALFLPVFYSS